MTATFPCITLPDRIYNLNYVALALRYRAEAGGERKMKIWLAAVLLLFVLGQLWEWGQHLSPPLPIFILSGLLLAIASNYDKRSGWPFSKND